MKRENLAVLLGFFDEQMEIIRKLWQEVTVTSPLTREKTSHLGYLLHNLYCAYEDLFQEVARTFENRLEDPARYHRELLKRMRLEVPGIRPRLLSTESFNILNELRGFRHIFRHAYSYELAAEKVAALKEKVAAGWESINSDLSFFVDFLKEKIDFIREKGRAS
jgi:hypothetical protein